MANLTTVGVTSGVPSSGTGTVSTLDNLIGTAGTPSAQVVSVQGHSGGTELAVSDSTAQTSLSSIDSGISSLVTDSFAKGTAGTASSDVITVQGISGMTAVKVDNSAVTQPVSNTALTDAGAGDYETVAASQTDQAMGATGASGDWLSGVLIVPATTSPGAVSIKDGSGSGITIFTGGATSVSNLVPFFVALGMKSGSGAWKITTGSNVSAIGIGNFT